MTIDKDEDVDKENEPPVIPLESLPNNILVPPIVIKKGENFYHQPESVIKNDDSRTKNSNQRTPPTGELPENNKSRKNKRFYFDDQKHRSLHAKRLGRCMVPKQRRKKHPGLRQVLSPKALYPSAPPGYKVHIEILIIKFSNAKNLIHIDKCKHFQESDLFMNRFPLLASRGLSGGFLEASYLLEKIRL